MELRTFFFLFVAGCSVTLARHLDAAHDGEDAMENPDFFEGDIIYGMDLQDRNAVTRDKNLWPNGRIPYVIESELNSKIPQIKRAMQHYADKTCIRWVEKTPEDEHFVRIFKGQGCYASIGRILSKENKISLGDRCYQQPQIIHEMGHVVGFFHEHSRSDRDDSLEIHFENIKPGHEFNFVKMARNQNRLFSPFDFDSVMMYGDTAFSKDKRGGLKTMTAKDGRVIQDTLDKPGLSKDDIIRISKMYKCPEKA